MNIFKKIPLEIHSRIYVFLNPIGIQNIHIKKKLWCFRCGEILKKGDWFMNLDDNCYILYECINCKYENIFNDEYSCDILLEQEYKD